MKDVYSLKAVLAKDSKLLNHANKRYAIVDCLNHSENPTVNQCAAVNIFQEAQSYGIRYNLAVVVTDSLVVHSESARTPLAKVSQGFEVYSLKSV